MTETVKNKLLKLVEDAKEAYVSSLDEAGFPHTRAMFSLMHDGLFTHYLSTNVSAEHTAQFRKDSRACLYFCEPSRFLGLNLIGTVEVCTDRKHREMLWHEGDEKYYPKGIDDEDYCVLKFTALHCRYYHGEGNFDKGSFTPESF